MERQTFILLNKRTFRHSMTVYMKGVTGKLEKRNVKFTTEHKVRENERFTNARTIAGEFSTTDELLYDGMLRDTGYGKTFIHKDDTDDFQFGKQATYKMKRDPFNVTPLDSKKLALESLFKIEGMQFDGAKTVEQLNEEYQFYMAAKTGVKLNKGEATVIPMNPIDIQKSIADQANAARSIYAEKYGEDVPDEFANDFGMLDALSNPQFDALAYMAEKKKGSTPSVDENGLPSDAESLGKIYFEEFQQNVANPKKNDAAWIKAKILERRGL
jgi:hypothetical protein